jgi:hypothetical protein
MRNIKLIILCFFIKASFSQNIKTISLSGDTLLPSGVFGWTYVEGTHEIKTYSYSHKVVKMMEIKRTDYAKLTSAVNGKNLGKKMWETFKNSNSIAPATILIIEEGTYDTTFKTIGFKTKYYHTSSLKGDYIRFSLINNSGNPNSEAKDEEVYEKGVDDIYDDFPFLEKCIELNQAPSFNYKEKYDKTVDKNKGMVGELSTQSFYLTYDYGWNRFDRMMKTKPLMITKDIPYLDETRLAKIDFKSTELADDEVYIPTWHIKNQEDKDDKRVYKCVTFNHEGEVVNSFTYKSKISKDGEFFNLRVFDAQGNHCGYLTVFGYDDKAPKEVRGEDKDSYEMIYTNLKGEKQLKVKFDNPVDKHKMVFDPNVAVYKDGKFYLSNTRMESIFKSTNELLIVDTSGVLTKGKFIADKVSRYVENVAYYKQNSKPELSCGINSTLWTMKFVSNNVDINPPYGDYQPRYRKLLTSKYNDQGTFQNAFEVLFSDSMNKPKLFLINKESNNATYLVKSGGYYFKFVLNDVSTRNAVYTNYTPMYMGVNHKSVPQNNDMQIIHILGSNVSYIMAPIGNRFRISDMVISRL